MSASTLNDPLHFVLTSANSAQQQQLARQAKRIEELEEMLSVAVAQIGVLSGEAEIVVRERMTGTVVESNDRFIDLVVDEADVFSNLQVSRQKFASGREVLVGDTVIIDTIGTMASPASQCEDEAEQVRLRQELEKIAAGLENRSIKGPVQL